ncbi:hypothetical protein MUDAN_MDHGFNIF_00238 [Lactiplantibacillus mudanjiangensis]|uniref:Uncharacterized protein n=1 Tax=Lactiplantibacillus mudanjiangensis TaxID=1296538 RepID=A0A660E206_9LACO|nr:hypothetical protein MUDAN_IGPPGNFN_00169 [Lactiplantibacillus mudanjiangensis]VDG26838.1 hypothetical protein MUDAN_MDHGFNIF_00238 [Lactiplantibacillus mudanjiangensis]
MKSDIQVASYQEVWPTITSRTTTVPGQIVLATGGNRP